MSLLDENFGIELDLAAVKYDEYKKRLDIFIDKIIEDIPNCPLSNSFDYTKEGIIRWRKVKIIGEYKDSKGSKIKIPYCFLTCEGASHTTIYKRLQEINYWFLVQIKRHHHDSDISEQDIDLTYNRQQQIIKM